MDPGAVGGAERRWRPGTVLIGRRVMVPLALTFHCWLAPPWQSPSSAVRGGTDLAPHGGVTSTWKPLD